MKKGWKPLGSRVEQRTDGSLSHRCLKKQNVRRPFMEHSDGITYEELTMIPLQRGGAIYIDFRKTEITDPKWYHRPLYWLFDKL